MYGADTSNYGNANQGSLDRGWWDKHVMKYHLGLVTMMQNGGAAATANNPVEGIRVRGQKIINVPKKELKKMCMIA